jgi:hypothetical protein
LLVVQADDVTPARGAPHSRLPILFRTGCASAYELERPEVPEHAGVLHKPCSVSALGAKVREALDRR